MHILINVFVFLCNWPDAFLEGAQGKLIPVVVVALPLVSQLTTSHSAKNSILCVILICLKIIIGLEFKGNNSQCRQSHHLLMLKWCFCTFSGYRLLVSQLTTSHSATNSTLCVILICLKIISDLEFKGNNSQCRQGHPC